jgi:SAM-dependent methyltransferase
MKSIDLGDLRRLEPISPEWGWDRGTPVDRYYIESFLADRAATIRGRVLEFGEPYYTKMFGSERVSSSELLDVSGGPTATYTCSLEEGDELPTDGFDCVICAQTLQYIYNLRDALRTLHRILKPGGSLLLTAPGIIATHPEPWPRFWSFTPSSIDTLCREFFDPDNVETAVFGNVLTASAFLYGLAGEELTEDELDHFDPAYVVTIGVRAVK